MDYREIAEKQHGFILPCQITKEDFNEAAKTGFIGVPPQDEEFMKYVYYTELVTYNLADDAYRDWLIAFPTIPPEKRHPMPYFACDLALRIQHFSASWSTAPLMMVAPPELMPYANKDFGITYIPNENITSDNWVLIDDIPVEKIISAMRKYYEHVRSDDFDDAVVMAFSAHRRGYSWEEITWALEPASGVWHSYKTGKTPINGKEVRDLFFEEHTPPQPTITKSRKSTKIIPIYHTRSSEF